MADHLYCPGYQEEDRIGRAGAVSLDGVPMASNPSTCMLDSTEINIQLASSPPIIVYYTGTGVARSSRRIVPFTEGFSGPGLLSFTMNHGGEHSM